MIQHRELPIDKLAIRMIVFHFFLGAEQAQHTYRRERISSQVTVNRTIKYFSSHVSTQSHRLKVVSITTFCTDVIFFSNMRTSSCNNIVKRILVTIRFHNIEMIIFISIAGLHRTRNSLWRFLENVSTLTEDKCASIHFIVGETYFRSSSFGYRTIRTLLSVERILSQLFTRKIRLK